MIVLRMSMTPLGQHHLFLRQHRRLGVVSLTPFTMELNWIAWFLMTGRRTINNWTTFISRTLSHENYHEKLLRKKICHLPLVLSNIWACLIDTAFGESRGPNSTKDKDKIFSVVSLKCPISQTLLPFYFCHIFPWLCVRGGCTILLCHLFHITPGKALLLFPSLCEVYVFNLSGTSWFESSICVCITLHMAQSYLNAYHIQCLPDIFYRVSV